MPRHHGVLCDWVGGRRLFRKWNSARHQGPGTSEACGCGKRSELFILALGFVLQRWEQGRVYRRVGWGSGSAVPSERPEQMGRGRDFRSEGRQAEFRELLQIAGGPG